MDIDTSPDTSPVEEEDPVDCLSESESIGEQDEEKSSSETQPYNQGHNISRLRGLGPFESRQNPLREVVGGPGSNSWKYENVSVEQSERLRAILKTTPKIDLKVHLSRHSGVICIAEAELIADRCPELAEEAMSIAVETCFRFSFVTSWIRLNTKYRTTPFWNNQVNEDWHAAAESQSVATLNRLNRDLSSNKVSLCNDGIRDVYKSMGDHYVAQGDLDRALTSYMGMQDYCVTPVQLIEMYIKNIEVSIGLKNFSNVKNFIMKSEQIDVLSSLPIPQAQKYPSAAITFLEYGHVIGTTFDRVLLAEDAAIYGGLLGIAFLPIPQLKKLCISPDGPGVALLELVPWVRDIVMDFYNNSWKSCLQGLERMLPVLSVDIYLHPHVVYLHYVIVNNCVIQCFAPYSRQAQHKNNERLSFSGLALTKKKSDPPKSVPIETSHVHLQFAESY